MPIVQDGEFDPREIHETIGKWSERQDSNLSKTGKTKGNLKGDSQIDSQKSVPLGPDLSRVVIAWSKLPEPLKAAILAIINAVEGRP
jgi:hypothetical protein